MRHDPLIRRLCAVPEYSLLSVSRVDVSKDVEARFHAPDLGEETGAAQGDVEVCVGWGVGYEDVGGEGDAGGPGRGGGVVLESRVGVSGLD